MTSTLPYYKAMLIIHPILPGNVQNAVSLKEVNIVEKGLTAAYRWVSKLSAFVGVVLIIIAVVTGLTNHMLKALPRTYIELAIAAFLFAIWALPHGLRDQSGRTK